jgi:integrase
MANTKPRAPRKSANGAKDKRANGEGSIYWDQSKKRWIGAAYDINGKLRRKSCLKRSEAEDFCHDQKKARSLGTSTFATNPKMKVSEFLDLWLATRGSIKPETRRNYETAIKNWISPHIGKFLVSAIRPATIENLYQKLDDAGFKAGTTNVVHAVLSKAFSDAVRLGELPVNPMDRVQKLTRKSVASKYIPKNDEIRIYAEATKNPFTHARIEIGLVMGLRPGEVLGLKWSDIDWNQKTLTIERQVQRVKSKGLVFQTSKTGKIRTLHLSDAQVEILLIHRYDQDSKKGAWIEDEDLLFPNSVGKKQDPKADHKAWKALLKTAGVKADYTRYQMRKTAFTNLSASGVDVRTIMEISGHSQASTLLASYVHATSESVKNALSVQDKNRPTVEMLKGIEIDRQLEEWIQKANLVGQHVRNDSPQG